MRSTEVVTLPLARYEYSEQDERTTRRTIEQAFADQRQDIVENSTKTSSTSSLSMRRFQFLLMGA
jgi:hypothetical protein